MKKNNKLSFDPIKNQWLLLFYLLVAELILAYSIPANILTQWVFLGALVNFMQNIAPVLGKITHETAEHPDAVRCYIFVTLALLPVKVWIFYQWLNSDRSGIYRYLVVSILTDQKPAEGDNFITDPLRQENQQPVKQKPRSLFSRLFWSTLILLFTVGECWVIYEYYTPDSSAFYDQLDFRRLVSEGYSMWSDWALQDLTLTSFLLAVSLCILRDYGIYFKQLFN